MQNTIDIQVSSEIGKLEAVILHQPGLEVENMTPRNAAQALYSDILNLKVANKEYAQFKGVLDKLTQTFEVKTLLAEVLAQEVAKKELISTIVKDENIEFLLPDLMNAEASELARQLLEGKEINKQASFSKYLDPNRYVINPLPNFFFTRDASFSVNNHVFMGQMANTVRNREAFIMEAIFRHHPAFNTQTQSPSKWLGSKPTNLRIEGGDVLIAREDVLLIGMGLRTSPQGIDAMVNYYKEQKGVKHIIVQELPDSPESFIHLDMVFTFLDKNKCAVYAPVILDTHYYKTIHITIDNGKIASIKEIPNILQGLSSLGIDLEPVLCGGSSTDTYTKEREQWHSGTNFFAVAPGKVIGYGRNTHTIDALNASGFEVLEAKKVIDNIQNPNDYERFVITIEGSELARGGGGARCMTMPIRRQKVEW